MDYRKLYNMLFNAATDALRELDRQNVGLAKDILMQAQINAEEVYLECCEDCGYSGDET